MQKRLAMNPVVLVLLVISMLAWPIAAAAPTARPEEVGLSAERLKRIDELMARHVDARNFAGAVTLVARNGRVAHLEAHGLMDLDAKKPMQTDAVFRIMSMTKPVVGVAVLMMMEEGKVRLNDPISRFIPEYKELKVAVAQGNAAPEPRFYTVPAEREITVRDLLTHTSGLISGTISSREERKVAATPEDSLATYLPRLGQVPLEFQPGTRWAYSAGAGFDVLSRVVEVASGTTIDRFMKERIFDPLGMKDTTYIPPQGNARLTTLYSRTAKGLQRSNDPGFMNGVYFSGGGGLFSTAEDYLQFAQMLLNGGELNGRRLLSPRLVELMGSVFAPDTLPGRPRGESYGLSVRVLNDPVARNSFLSEGSFGWSGLFGTHFWIDPKEKVVGILMAQTSVPGIREDFENAVAQAIVAPARLAGTN